MDEIGKLGFGFMRLPVVEGDGGKEIDIEQVKHMVDLFMDAGFTYFDTARGYHNGRSEAALREAVVERYPRESFQVATKLPAWLAKNADHARAMFDKSLRETGAGYFDFFLLHNLGEERTRLFDDFGLWDFLHEKKEAGLIRNLGFSIHDKAAVLEEVLEAHPEVDFVQLQINYADWESETVESRKCYEAARAHGLPVVVMEPVKGGSLVHLPEEAADVLRAVNQDESLARVRAILDGVPTVPCTDCRYCLKNCPQGVRIPAVLASLNILELFHDMHRAQENYDWNASSGPASACVGCGACESVCPQHIEIVKELGRAAELFEKKPA